MNQEDKPFGPNDWLIDEMYRQYQDDPNSVSDSWREFFSDYTPESESGAAYAPAVELPRTEQQEVADAAPPAASAEIPQVAEGESTPLTGVDAVIVKRMEESLGVPTATSVRVVPARLLEVNRTILNRYLARTRGGKVSFTHLIGYAVVKALGHQPQMNSTFEQRDGRPSVIKHKQINLGLAVDVAKKDGGRTLVVPNIKAADTLDFASLFAAYEEVVRRTHAAELGPDDYAGTTITITNPGTLGTVQSVPRLMAGQAVIVGVGAIGYPAEWQAADPQTLADIGVGKVISLTSTYDHRVIQGAESGEFLGRIHGLLLGEDRFYEEVFRSMRVPYVPAKWHEDLNPPEDSLDARRKHARVLQIINQYRVRGHLIADLDPLEKKLAELHPELDPNTYGLTIWDLDRKFITGGLAGKQELPLGTILGILRDAYCRTSSVEYMHISDPDQKRWIQNHVEGVSPDLGSKDQLHILDQLIEAEVFETFLHNKYLGHKRFSLEGAESLVPMLGAVLERSADDGLEEAAIGMAHRGRLNVLATVIGKSYEQIFREFEGDIDPDMAQGSGDVKYHLGASGKHVSQSGAEIPVSVASNPSHLESVDPVLEGIVRAKIDFLEAPGRVLPILVHGDAAFAGQGVVAETLAMSQLSGYRTFGTVHIVVNNQLGFTTGSNYARSSEYATDIAKMVQAPIFHVNGDDPEACVRVARLAYDFRKEFEKDVVIDMWCYRKWGHNEGDEPSFTQPLMYERIKSRRPVRKQYMERLVNRGDLTVEAAEESLELFRSRLQDAHDAIGRSPVPQGTGEVKEQVPDQPVAELKTTVGRDVLDAIVQKLTTVPEGFSVHPKLRRWLDTRAKALDAGAVDWAFGESLSFGSLLLDGTWIRLSGQDSRRGTFSQRHLALVDQTNGDEYQALCNLDDRQGKFLAYDSPLSEFAVLGFEYGYSIGNPDALVLWEAQFGDFVDGAQTIIDEFISSAEDKWGQTSRLVLLLPHGYEGQGPDHSSARPERFLQLAAENNLQVVIPSTPAQYFHLLRRQALRDRASPLIVINPKSLLRLPAARSTAADLTEGGFQPVIDDARGADAQRLILCQGKVYYDLLAGREDNGNAGRVRLVRLEQPYPFPADQLGAILESNSKAEVVWVQEEPENMGSWTFVERQLLAMGLKIRVISRPPSASPATGSNRMHQIEQAALVERAFEGI